MANIKLLKPRQVETLGVGTHADGGNLFLRVRSKHSRQWIFRYKRLGKVTEISIGPTLDRKITEARDLAEEMRRAVRDGLNPAAVIRKAAPSGPSTFKDYAQRIDEHRRPTLRPGRHVDKFANSLRDYVYPFIGDKQPGHITYQDVEDILKQPVMLKDKTGEHPFWSAKYETASRVRRRIEAVLDYADRVEGRDRRNPAAWKGGLEHSQLGRPTKVTHHPSLPYSEIPKLMTELRQKSAMSSLCLQFIILTACRSGEARGAIWSEIDLKGRVWTLPPARTKMDREWRVPLSPAAIDILKMVQLLGKGPNCLVFPNALGKPLTDVAVSKTLKSLRPEVTVHGFRASFRTWGAEKTPYSNEVLERALSHVDGNKLRAAYQRSDLFRERVSLAADWAVFCVGSSSPRRNSSHRPQLRP
ncbi:MAG TPA: integrase arm-type DNA-binding domain-containing protein [Sphingomicrobium sp.]|nr:integrase arm-type DNA-binding domain-containing protein [Sphingomicrobium sp.]